ncbi:MULTISPECIES: FKBP-type peptidyl-prolyl cis-trans isomerase [Gammaproteobacteria]|uniref:Peptidyl-prolyl cis-trans isomerase n=2 Tax=Halomonadaceae TaxID=28256 RepID=A0A2A2F4P9_9GAMM|nr:MULTISPECIES: FKBP-type peptidyl-prolyl cis-trans isomerase [Gammaproteobacteria]KAA8982445.1 FKBP-type peptidyl-prolyl cis-trans isomerase [Halospina sp. K52047b]MYL27748.1 FKBP-type peptidyl-prolyl cis-trans isomerase [Halomonas utahensis]MYL75478.1 FKBP-type peptidyl-prolyl cis-trans isomerase [Halomonas sp. 22501_18_FS]PAU79599.1 peptidylprolyl isomerase [Halovibrio salipaludis]
MSVIGPDSQVTLHFALRLEDGSDVDSTFEKEPATLTVGDGNLPEAFERCLHGLKAGDRQTFSVPPEDAFGQPNPNNVQTFKRREFSPELPLEEGMVLSFADAAKAEVPGVIKAFDDDTVEVDFNHPLSGKTLEFEVSIVDVQ